MQIQDKRVVVTGAASGIGKALCEAFNTAGAKSVVCVDMNIDGATETANGQKQIHYRLGCDQANSLCQIFIRTHVLNFKFALWDKQIMIAGKTV